MDSDLNHYSFSHCNAHSFQNGVTNRDSHGCMDAYDVSNMDSDCDRFPDRYANPDTNASINGYRHANANRDYAARNLETVGESGCLASYKPAAISFDDVFCLWVGGGVGWHGSTLGWEYLDRPRAYCRY